jgi:pyrimidine-nucleoside phosphorylase
MSGRGLGITGGTVDKLASIPGMRLDLTPEQMKSQALRIGLALTGQTPNLAPADKALYALRDATGTVASMPLIVSSILSKKVAGGADTVVLDVKCGSGAFMKSLAEATELARWLGEVGTQCGLNIRIAITDMEQPLGSTVGNALEVKEAFDVLRGKAGRFTDLCISLAGLTLAAAGVSESEPAGRSLAKTQMDTGSAWEKAKVWVREQGGDLDAFDSLPSAPYVFTQVAPRSGWIASINAGMVGNAVVQLGGGRQRKEDIVNPSVGVVLGVEVGSKIEKGQPLFEVHAGSENAGDSATAHILEGISWSDEPIEKQPAIKAMSGL